MWVIKDAKGLYFCGLSWSSSRKNARRFETREQALLLTRYWNETGTHYRVVRLVPKRKNALGRETLDELRRVLEDALHALPWSPAYPVLSARLLRAIEMIDKVKRP